MYRGKDCMKKFYEFTKSHAIKIINFKKKKMRLVTKEQQQSYENAKICYICKEKFENKYLKDKKYRKARDHCNYTREYGGAAYSICNLVYSVPIFMASLLSNLVNNLSGGIHRIKCEYEHDDKKM